MKFFGYAERETSTAGLLEMREVTFAGSAGTIRKIAKFLMAAAEEMERKPRFDHVHLCDSGEDWDEAWPDLIVASAE